MKNNGLSSIWSSIHDRFKNPSEILYLAFVGFVVGVCGASVISLFRICKDASYDYVLNWLSSHHSWLLFSYFIVAIIAALIVGYLIRNTAIRYGGIKWIKEALIDGQNRPWMKISPP